MKLIQENRGLFLSLVLILVLFFIYGCKCEGGIGSFSDSGEAVKTNSVQPESK